MTSLKVKPLTANHIEIETEFGTFDIVSNFDHISIYKVGYDKMNITAYDNTFKGKQLKTSQCINLF